MNISISSNSFLKRLRAGAHQDPVRDWIAMLICSAIVLAGIIVWNVWVFDTVARGGIIGSGESSPSPAFNSSFLDAIHPIFEKRAAEATKYETGIYRYADPSQ